MGIILDLKHNKPNLYSLLISLMLSLWYNGVSGMLNHFVPDRGFKISLILLLLPLLFLLSDDGSLSELYNGNSAKAGQITTIAVNDDSRNNRRK
jgi:hypothetical protein